MKKPIIIGAGVSALVAALELEKAGCSPTILEVSNRAGGRVKTDELHGYPLDFGFQVLLTAYPEAQHYLDYKKLDLVKFLPGSVIFKNGKMEKIGDPLRNPSFLWSTIVAKIGTLNDKRLILKLSIILKKKQISAIFDEPETSTMVYLKTFGFSDAVIHDFFQPFFAGIYLEENLETSSRMFEFVYKMFGTGYAAIPRKGMQAIPDQLVRRLKKTTFRFNTNVDRIEGQTIFLESGETITADQILIATDPSPFFSAKQNIEYAWKSCHNLYFRSSKPILNKALIGLLPGQETWVNNFHYLDPIFGKQQESVLSVTVVKKHQLPLAELVKAVQQELKKRCNMDTSDLIKDFLITKALPKISDLKYQPTEKSVVLAPGIFCCGDYLANSSLNAAMASGRVAAKMMLEEK